MEETKDDKIARLERELAAANARIQQLQVRWLRHALEQAILDTKVYHRSVLTGRCIP